MPGSMLLLSALMMLALPMPQPVLVPGGSFEMGCHDTLGTDDELPIHDVSVDSFWMGNLVVTNEQYCAYLNSAYLQGLIEVNQGLVYAVGDTNVFCEVAAAVDSGSGISFAGDTFYVALRRENHPMVCVRWFGAVAYCNWLSAESGYTQCYNLATGDCDFEQDGFRLPTEAEWEFAARGGQYGPYYTYPWGNNRDTTRTNWPGSADPYEAGPNPWTTPCGFYDGELHRKMDFEWPGSQQTFQTADGANGYGLYDMAGNTWNWCNDWYGHTYYGSSPSDNPRGPEIGTPMPDGKPYRCLRGGSWYNATHYPGDHSRCSNRDPAYYRGPGDPNGPWFQVSFRVVRPCRGATAVKEGGVPGRKAPWLKAASPCRGTATIRFGTASSGHVLLTINDLSGRLVRTLVDGFSDSGAHEITWDGTGDYGRRVGRGVFFCRLCSGDNAVTLKLLKLDGQESERRQW